MDFTQDAFWGDKLQKNRAADFSVFVLLNFPAGDTGSNRPRARLSIKNRERHGKTHLGRVFWTATPDLPGAGRRLLKINPLDLLVLPTMPIIVGRLARGRCKNRESSEEGAAAADKAIPTPFRRPGTARAVVRFQLPLYDDGRQSPLRLLPDRDEGRLYK